MTSIFVARQPIFELGGGLYGYELLYRRDASIDRADGDEGYMSAEVIVTSLLGIGLPAISGGGIAFVNFSRRQLLEDTWSLFDPAAVMIELLESVKCDADTLAACQRLVKAGYRLALDDYVVEEETRPLVELASVIKVDILGRTPEDVGAVAAELRPTGARLLAERVETATIRDMCANFGYELFQGYLFSRPETLSKTDVSAGQLALMRLLNLLQDPDTTDAQIDSAFASDVALAYKLLRIVNAASMGGRGITSIPHAVRLIGRKTLHRWLSVVLIASLGEKGDVSRELALTAMTRARLCELLVTNAAIKSDAGSAFIIGLLSLLDVLLEIPMDKILSRLELSDDVCGALLNRTGPLARPLKVVEAYESADWDRAESMAKESSLAPDLLPNLYIDALHWAAQRVTD